ncbi:MAG: hypothetical protein QG582_589, partial [Candidatus Thermoplasmatota archaeon]|nr:hypothetical protein [Candidatus Thermoplasmatota archaeon]
MYGTRRIIACAGMAFVIMASSLMFSLSALGSDVAAAGADLTVSDVLWIDMHGRTGSTDAVLTSGQPFTVLATVENIGSKDAGSFITDLRVDGASLGGVVSADGLVAHGSLVVTWAGIVVSECLQHEALVVADSGSQVAEVNPEGTAEANNERAEVFGIVPAKWTFAVYADGDNNLEYYAYLDFLEMALVGSSPEVNLVIQIDRVPGYSNDSGDWTDAKRFLVTQGMEPLAENAYEDLGEVNMGDGAVLADFAADTFDRFRADHTSLILWDHGSGWYGGCCRDMTSANDSLGTDEMRQAMEETVAVVGAKVAVIGFDACVMGSMEVCYAFEGLCEDFVASEDMLPGTGWPYDAILQRLVETPSMGPEELSEIMTAEYVAEYPDTSISSEPRRHRLCGQPAPRLRMQRAHPQLLRMPVRLVEVP